MPKCPKCGENIDTLKFVETTETKYNATYDDTERCLDLDKAEKELVIKEEYSCPLCNEVIFMNWKDATRFFSEQREKVLPPTAIEAVANSSWAHGLAEDVCGKGYAGFSLGTSEYERCVYNVSHQVAARVLGMTWTPPSSKQVTAPAKEKSMEPYM